MGRRIGASPACVLGAAAFLAAAVAAGAADIAPGILSAQKNAAVTVGGEIHTDFAYRRASESGTGSAWSLRRSNLRIRADVHPAATVFFKLDLSDSEDGFEEDSRILEEALLVMRSVAGTGLDVFAGKGRAPYGQDVTLGMLQSYHHIANQADSSEGALFIVDPAGDAADGPKGKIRLPPMRPGQFDRAVTAGAAYQWDERWRVEAAVFQPDDAEYRARLDRTLGDDSSLGFAARVWWRPVEDLTLQASAAALHSSDMGAGERRIDLGRDGQAGAVKNSWAASVGFDWRSGPWRVFGEYQHGWNSNFSRGYSVDAAQLGGAREIAGGRRLGVMAEWLRIGRKNPIRREDVYVKAAVNFRLAVFSHAHILFEYGREWARERNGDGGLDKKNGTFFGMRFGLMY